MNKSVIVYGPQGCGKTRWAERIAKHFGLTRIVDGWGCSVFLPHGTLYLTNNEEDVRLWNSEENYMSFAEVAQQINDAIPRTQWFPMSAQPEREGVYELRVIGFEDYTHWSAWKGEWKTTTGSALRAAPQTERSWGAHNHSVNDAWRGLVEEPIVVEGAA
jgi:hypothetical protein